MAPVASCLVGLFFEAAVYFSSRGIKVPRIFYKTSEHTKKLGPASPRRQSTQKFLCLAVQTSDKS